MNKNGLYKNLETQFNKLFRHLRAGSYKTRERYGKAFKRFMVFLSQNYNLQKLANISEKHILAYVEHMQEKGLSASTVKTELSAIRLFHDQIPDTRYILPSNEQLNLERRKFGGVDRTWSEDEFDRMLKVCLIQERKDYACIISLGYYAGLRIEECFKLGTAQAEAALKTDTLTVKGKGGLVREVPIQESIKIELEKMLKVTPRGQKLFVKPGEKTHLNKKKLQNFIGYHRKTVMQEGHDVPLTFHGLRHTCAARWYKELRTKGYSDFSARKQVSAWLGHGRDDVTRIYLAGIKDGDGDV